MKKARDKTGRAGIATLKEFAAALEVPVPTLSRWIRHDLWKWKKKSPWPRGVVPQILRWAAENMDRGRPSLETLDPKGATVMQSLRRERVEEEIRKFRTNANIADVEFAEKRGALHDADACEAEAIRRASLYRNAVQNLPSQVVSMALSHGMPHAGAPAFQKQVQDLVNDCLRLTAASANTRSKDSDAASIPGAAAA